MIRSLNLSIKFSDIESFILDYSNRAEFEKLLKTLNDPVNFEYYATLIFLKDYSYLLGSKNDVTSLTTNEKIQAFFNFLMALTNIYIVFFLLKICLFRVKNTERRRARLQFCKHFCLLLRYFYNTCHILT